MTDGEDNNKCTAKRPWTAPNIGLAVLAAVVPPVDLKTHKSQLCGTPSPLTMAFNPLSLLVLKSRGRSVAVFRDHCTRYEVSRPTNSCRQFPMV